MQALWWLPESRDWDQLSAKARTTEDLIGLARSRLDFVQTLKLDRKLQRDGKEQAAPLRTVRLAILSSSTADHLVPGLRVAALRRGLRLEVYVCAFGQHQQELMNSASGLHAFRPEVVVFAFDAAHMCGLALAPDEAAAEDLVEYNLMRMKGLWVEAADRFKAQIIQQTLLPTPEPLLGGNEYRLAVSPLRIINKLNDRLRQEAVETRVDILPLEHWTLLYGLDAWHDPALWHRARQEISPAAAALYGDLVLRLVGARLGLSGKCLVLDLDNTLWGGVIGDVGLDGIVLGQGSAVGEGFSHFQRYAKALTQRGIILAVCSKNNPANALAAFEQHPEMILRARDVAVFRINWQDKATNLREIAAELNIGLDALVFADDNPFERNIIRAELPMAMVPELPDDPALYARCISESGYFEAVDVTAEDVNRAGLYSARNEEATARAKTTDLDGYLKGLDMRLQWAPFQAVDVQRITQLTNKTNQFNLRTKRYTEADISGLMGRPDVLTLQLRLVDRFADHGIISLLIAPLGRDGVLNLETWLMSCRVLGRGVEEAVANVLFAEARRRNVNLIRGEYIRTAKNEMVEDFYSKLGFCRERATSETSYWSKPVEEYAPLPTHITAVKL